MFTRALLIILCCLCSFNVVATHIVGGFIQLKAVSPARNKYAIRVEVVMDGTKGATPRYVGSSDVEIYRKSDNRYVTSVRLPGLLREVMKFKNPACKDFYKLDHVRFVWENLDVTLPTETYSDPAGYVIVWGDCCRNTNIINIRNASSAGSLLTLDFDPLQKSGKLFADSTPRFNLRKSDFMCIGEPFSLYIGADDPDGDELRYSLVTPAGSYNSTGPAQLTWNPGYSETNAISGAPPLRIDPRGLLTVTPDKEGLFAFSVRCDEYRNGQKIGSVLLDYYLPAYDCRLSGRPPKPTIFTDAQPTGVQQISVCYGNRVTLKTQTGAYYYEWRRNEIDIEGADQPSLSVNTEGYYSVTLYDANKCAAPTTSDSVRVVDISQKLKIQALSDTILCASDSATLEATVPPGVNENWFWTRNGQPIGVSRQKTIVVRQSGQYSLSGDWKTNPCVRPPDTIYVTAYPTPVVSIISNYSVACTGDTLLLQATPASTTNTYEWTDPGNTVASRTARVSSRLSGIFRLRVTTPYGCSYSTTTAGQVRFEPVTELVLSPAGSQTICQSDSLLVTATTPGITAFEWTRDGQLVSNAANRQRLYVRQGGTYALTGAWSRCVRLKNNLKLTVRPLPVVTLKASQPVTCVGTSVTFTASSAAGNRYDWQSATLSGASLSTLTSFATDKPGVYRVRITDPAGCSTVSTTAALTRFVPISTLRLIASGSTTICAGDSVLLNVVGPDSLRFNWYNSNAVAAGYSRKIALYQSGRYYVGDPGWQAINCIQAPDTIDVRVNPKPSVRIIPNRLEFCAGDTATLQAISGANTQISWQQNGIALGNQPFVRTQTAGRYIVLATNEFGCKQDTSFTYRPVILPTPVFDLGDNRELWQSGSIQIHSIPDSSNYLYHWKPGTGVSAIDIAHPLLSPERTTTYTLTVTNQAGCAYSDTVRIVVWPRVFTPDAFSPNGDSVNDQWKPINLEFYPDADVTVFNRWGEIIYSRKMMENQPFDGSYRGNKLPPGVYPYHINLNIRQAVLRGTVTILP